MFPRGLNKYFPFRPITGIDLSFANPPILYVSAFSSMIYPKLFRLQASIATECGSSGQVSQSWTVLSPQSPQQKQDPLQPSITDLKASRNIRRCKEERKRVRDYKHSFPHAAQKTWEQSCMWSCCNQVWATRQTVFRGAETMLTRVVWIVLVYLSPSRPPHGHHPSPKS